MKEKGGVPRAVRFARSTSQLDQGGAEVRKAIAEGNLSRVTWLILEDKNLLQREFNLQSGNSLLMDSILIKDVSVELVIKLLELGADTSYINYTNETALGIAPSTGRWDLVEVILDFEIKKKQEVELLTSSDSADAQKSYIFDKNKITLAVYCIKSAKQEIFLKLIKLDSQILAYTDAKGNTLLHAMATLSDDIITPELINKFANLGIDINKKNIFGISPLKMALQNKNLDTALKLIELGADFSDVRFELLEAAMQERNFRLIDFLIDADHEIIYTLKYGVRFAPLYIAIRSGDTEIVKYILTKIKEIDRSFDFNDSSIFPHNEFEQDAQHELFSYMRVAIEQALEKENYEILEILLNENQNLINIMDTNETSLLDHALKYVSRDNIHAKHQDKILKLVDWFIENRVGNKIIIGGFDFESRRVPPLVALASLGNVKTAARIIGYYYSNDILHDAVIAAAYMGNSDMMQCLISAGGKADYMGWVIDKIDIQNAVIITYDDEYQMTALDAALVRGNWNTARTLISIISVNEQGVSDLYQPFDILEELLNPGSYQPRPPNSQVISTIRFNPDISTIAAARAPEAIDILEFLIDQQNHRTPQDLIGKAWYDPSLFQKLLAEAVKRDNIKAIELLVKNGVNINPTEEEVDKLRETWKEAESSYISLAIRLSQYNAALLLLRISGSNTNFHYDESDSNFIDYLSDAIERQIEAKNNRIWENTEKNFINLIKFTISLEGAPITQTFIENCIELAFVFKDESILSALHATFNLKEENNYSKLLNAYIIDTQTPEELEFRQGFSSNFLNRLAKEEAETGETITERRKLLKIAIKLTGYYLGANALKELIKENTWIVEQVGKGGRICIREAILHENKMALNVLIDTFNEIHAIHMPQEQQNLLLKSDILFALMENKSNALLFLLEKSNILDSKKIDLNELVKSAINAGAFDSLSTLLNLGEERGFRINWDLDMIKSAFEKITEKREFKFLDLIPNHELNYEMWEYHKRLLYKIASSDNNINILRHIIETRYSEVQIGQYSRRDILFHIMQGAIEHRACEIIKYLLKTHDFSHEMKLGIIEDEEKYSIEELDMDVDERETFFSRVLTSGNIELIKAFVENGASLTKKDNNGQGPLHYLARRDSAERDHKTEIEIVEYVIKMIGIESNALASADHSNIDIIGYTDNAAYDHVNVVHNHMNLQDNSGKTPLHCAIENGAFHIAAQLLDSGIDPDIQDNLGKTAMYYAVEFDNLYVLEKLISRNGKKLANPNIEAEDGTTPLYRACLRGRHSLVQALLADFDDGEVGKVEEETDTPCIILPREIEKVPSVDIRPPNGGISLQAFFYPPGSKEDEETLRLLSNAGATEIISEEIRARMMQELKESLTTLQLDDEAVSTDISNFAILHTLDNIKKWLSDSNFSIDENFISSYHKLFFKEAENAKMLTDKEIIDLEERLPKIEKSYRDIKLQYNTTKKALKIEQKKLDQDKLDQVKPTMARAVIEERIEKLNSQLSRTRESYNDIKSRYHSIKNLLQALNIKKEKWDDVIERLYGASKDRFVIGYNQGSYNRKFHIYEIVALVYGAMEHYANIVIDKEIIEKKMAVDDKPAQQQMREKIKSELFNTLIVEGITKEKDCPHGLITAIISGLYPINNCGKKIVVLPQDIKQEAADRVLMAIEGDNADIFKKLDAMRIRHDTLYGIISCVAQERLYKLLNEEVVDARLYKWLVLNLGSTKLETMEALYINEQEYRDLFAAKAVVVATLRGNVKRYFEENATTIFSEILEKFNKEERETITRQLTKVAKLKIDSAFYAHGKFELDINAPFCIVENVVSLFSSDFSISESDNRRLEAIALCAIYAHYMNVIMNSSIDGCVPALYSNILRAERKTVKQDKDNYLDLSQDIEDYFKYAIHHCNSTYADNKVLRKNLKACVEFLEKESEAYSNDTNCILKKLLEKMKSFLDDLENARFPSVIDKLLTVLEDAYGKDMMLDLRNEFESLKKEMLKDEIGKKEDRKQKVHVRRGPVSDEAVDGKPEHKKSKVEMVLNARRDKDMGGGGHLSGANA